MSFELLLLLLLEKGAVARSHARARATLLAAKSRTIFVIFLAALFWVGRSWCTGGAEGAGVVVVVVVATGVDSGVEDAAGGADRPKKFRLFIE